MILLESDLKKKYGIDSAKCEARPREDLYDFLDETRKSVQDKELEKTKSKIIKAEKVDLLSRSYLDALIKKDKESATRYLNDFYSGNY